MKIITKKQEQERKKEISELKHKLDYYKKNFEVSEVKKELEKAEKKYNHIIGKWYENDECFFQVLRVGFRIKYNVKIELYFECYAPNWEDPFDLEIWRVEKLKPLTKKQREAYIN